MDPLSIHVYLYSILSLIVSLLHYTDGRGLPTVDPGLFVISGVGTCGNGEGYCLLGLDCTLDEDFLPDDEDGHCEGLKSAFTPSAHFVCCKDTNKTSKPNINLKPKPGITRIPDTTMTPHENEININMLTEIVQNTNLSNIINKTRHTQPSKQVNNDIGMIDEGKETTTSDNKYKIEEDVTTEDTLNNEDTTITTTESVIDIGLTTIEPNLNNIENEEHIKFDEVSLKSDEAYASKEEPMKGDAEWLAAANEEHLNNYDDKNAEDNTEASNNEVNLINEDEIKNSNVLEQERDQESENNENTTDKDNQFHVTDSFTTELPTTDLPITNYRGDIHRPINQRPDKANDPEPFHDDNLQGSSEPTPDISPSDKPCGMSAGCIGLLRFSFDNNPLCHGNPLHDDWVVTSATCALRVFRMGMFNVTVSPDEDSTWPSGGKVRTIIVHENYRSTENELHLEVNNIGLLRIYPGLGWDLCRACLPNSHQQFNGERCATHPVGTPPQQVRYRYGEQMRSSTLCEGNTELLPGSGDFLSLPCPASTWKPRAFPNMTPNSGLPLRCDGILAGVQASEGVGTRIYTPLSSYLEWIELNSKSPPTPLQTFRRMEY